MITDNLVFDILLFIFILLLLHYIFFLSNILIGIKKLHPSHKNRTDDFVSVIIPFRNEEENILTNLKSIEAQNFPAENFEVIYVNDSSTDDSLNILLKNKTVKNIKVLSVPDEYSPNAHKKRAIRFGIENSKGKIIATTDADCTHNENWLSSLLNNFNDETGFVSGPVEFTENNSFFSKLQKLEFAGLIITGAGLIGAGKPTICNAANIAYRKNVFDEVGGFKDQMNLSSGDDELLMQKIAKDTNYKVKFSVNKHSIVKTPANKSIKEFYHQRKRWASKGLFYGNKSLVIKLILIYLFYIGLITQLVLTLIVSPYFLVTFSASILLKTLFEYSILLKGKKLLFKNLNLKPFFIAEIFQVPYIIIAGFWGAFGNLMWKERKIKR